MPIESLVRYRLSRHADGSWHVLDQESGGPVEIIVGGSVYYLWKLPQDEAEQWSILLNGLVKRSG